ncbi:hypothetical protein HZY62_10520 [Maribacter polysiphoniae]|uniref:Uncharacterized protein n=1 Tax=Maribacter polysiphoniae TaxID=429344 RepID=A0A316DZB2_9FLAO|nr:hypothetical protein [Maribacter polysiphoniae]MBD1261022.1 hypothetical protein [Maribacter polysiphoniae]PWK23737.1 hypothetical protein LX92_02304 [Maribacter polysiphoniae]
MRKLIVVVGLIFSIVVNAQQYTDTPYLQDYAVKYELQETIGGTALWQVESDRNLAIKVLSADGLLNAFGNELSLDLQYRPLTDMNIIAFDNYQDQFVYLTDTSVLSNAWGGTYEVEHGLTTASHFAIGSDFKALVASINALKLIGKEGKVIWETKENELHPISLKYDKRGNRFLMLTANALYEIVPEKPELKKIYSGSNLTAFALSENGIVLGTGNGVITLSGNPLKAGEINQKLPWTEITSITNINEQLWFGSTKGAFKLREDGKYDYYASKRWLVDDVVIDIAKGPENSVLIATKTGLSQINFVSMTLAEKADYFQKIQRLRHIRYGLTVNLELKTPGDLTSGYYHDTDNDGLWTSMYLAGELYRYAVTKDEDAKQNAYEAFEAMERLTAITPMHGFPARSFERDGYEVGLHANGFSEEWYKKHVAENGRIWRLTPDGKWRWKSTTSSDETCGHFYVHALFAELAPDQEWRDRAIHQLKIQMDHIMDNNWYLVDWNGEPTAWGKWNPKYVNSFPINVGDRRLNSTLILSFLQTTYHFTKDEKYKKAALKLIKRYGYDENANRPATTIGYVEGEDLSDRWNHSDDEMYFLTIPGFVNYSFTEEQRKKHFETVKSHWEVERSEKNPLWNYLFALTGSTTIDSEESAWNLREFPMDLIDWKIDNSHRKDLIMIEPNFRSQTYSEVLPGDERVLHKHNGAYKNNGGNARQEYAPYIYLLPYWAGRYAEAISAPVKE